MWSRSTKSRSSARLDTAGRLVQKSSGIREIGNNHLIIGRLNYQAIRVNMKKDEIKNEMETHCGQQYGKHQITWLIKEIMKMKRKEKTFTIFNKGILTFVILPPSFDLTRMCTIFFGCPNVYIILRLTKMFIFLGLPKIYVFTPTYT